MDSKVKEFSSRVERKVQQFKSVFQDRGIVGLTEAIGDDLDQWKNKHINMGVTGEAGSGKSTFINSLRGLNADSAGAAKVGNTTVTTSVKAYPHPSNPKCILWDLPGIGTDGFPKDTYLKTIDIPRFDFFVIISCDRFTVNDKFLAHAIEATGKLFFFVRTKFDNDLENEKFKKKGNVDEHKLKEVVLSDCKKNLSDFKRFDNIFVIDSFMKDRFDFNFLAKSLIDGFEKVSGKKQVALILTLSAMTREAIEEKKIILEKRIYGTALKAAFAPRIFGSDTKVLMEEKEFYRKQFGLDQKAIEKDAEAANIRVQLKNIVSDLKEKDESYVANSDLNKAIEACIPFLTSAYNIYKIYTAGKIWLRQTLDSLTESAIHINSQMVEGVASNDLTYSRESEVQCCANV